MDRSHPGVTGKWRLTLHHDCGGTGSDGERVMQPRARLSSSSSSSSSSSLFFLSLSSELDPGTLRAGDAQLVFSSARHLAAAGHARISPTWSGMRACVWTGLWECEWLLRVNCSIPVENHRVTPLTPPPPSPCCVVARCTVWFSSCCLLHQCDDGGASTEEHTHLVTGNNGCLFGTINISCSEGGWGIGGGETPFSIVLC